MAQIILTIFMTIWGAAWRRIDGSDHKPTAWHLTALLFFILPTAVIYDMHGAKEAIHAYVAYLFIWAGLLAGFNDWKDPSYMFIRYTGYTGIVCALFDVSGWYMLCGLIAGLHYPIGNYISQNYKGYQYTVYAELVAGATLFGGLTYFLF